MLLVANGSCCNLSSLAIFRRPAAVVIQSTQTSQRQTSPSTLSAAVNSAFSLRLTFVPRPPPTFCTLHQQSTLFARPPSLPSFRPLSMSHYPPPPSNPNPYAYNQPTNSNPYGASSQPHHQPTSTQQPTPQPQPSAPHPCPRPRPRPRPCQPFHPLHRRPHLSRLQSTAALRGHAVHNRRQGIDSDAQWLCVAMAVRIVVVWVWASLCRPAVQCTSLLCLVARTFTTCTSCSGRRRSSTTRPYCRQSNRLLRRHHHSLLPPRRLLVLRKWRMASWSRLLGSCH